MVTFLDSLKHARRAGVPLVWLATPDPIACVRYIRNKLAEEYGGPMIQWDCAAGVKACNEAGIGVASEFDADLLNPAAFLESVEDRLPEDGIAIFHAADLFIQSERPDPGLVQGVLNLRDSFKANGRTLILLSQGVVVPSYLRDHVTVLDEPYPDQEELAKIVAEVDHNRCDAYGDDPLPEDVREKAVHAVTGLAAYSAENVLSMACREKGIDLEHAWASWRAVVEQTRGLSVYLGGESFKDLGGLEPIKKYLTSLVEGRKKFRLVVWLDEVEKSGLANRQETSGVNADQEGQLLTWLEDHNVYGTMLVGVPGSGKSAVCKAVGSEFELIVVRIDLGAMQGSLVGESQQHLRNALKLIEAIGGNNTLWLATSNSIEGLSPAMRSRFTDTFYFDLPSAEELKAVWKVWLGKYPDVKPAKVKDDGWVPRNVRQCVEKAYMMDIPLTEAAEYIVPVGSVERESIEALRHGASGRYLSAQVPGVYKKPSEKGGRKMVV